MHSLCINFVHIPIPTVRHIHGFGLLSKKSDVRIIWWVYRERERGGGGGEGESDISLLGTDS